MAWALADVDPISALGSATSPLLFQFGKRDFYIDVMTASELYGAAPEPKRLAEYEVGHEMDLAVIEQDRLQFLAETIRLAD